MRPRPLLTLATALLAAAVLAPAAASAAPVLDGVFDLPSTPHHLALGPDGNVWIALDGLADNIARVTPDGTVRTFTSADVVNPIGIAAGPDGQLWVTESGGVAHFSPADPAAARKVAIADLTSPNAIVAGPDRALWTASNDEAIRIATDERFAAFRPAGLVGARGIAAGADGNLYVADFGARQVLAVTTAGAAGTAYPVDDAPQEVAVGPGGQLAVTLPSNLIGRFTPPSAAVQNATATGTDPFGIAFAPDGAYWVASFARDELLRMTPDGAVTTLGGFARSSGPRQLTVGANGTLWVGLEASRQVARVSGVTAPPSGGGGGGGGGGGTGGAGSTPPAKPVLSGVRVPATLRLGHAGTLRLTLSQAATVTVRFQRLLAGRRHAGRCVPPHRAPHGRRCVRLGRPLTQRLSAASGADRLRIGGRIGRRVLPLGDYRVTIVASDAAGASAPVTRRLRVVAPRRRR